MDVSMSMCGDGSNVIRKLRKKLRQIQCLERVEREFTIDEERKLNKKEELRSDLQELLQEQEHKMVVLTENIINTSVTENISYESEKVKIMNEFDQQTVQQTLNSEQTIADEHNVHVDVNGVHDIEMSEDAAVEINGVEEEEHGAVGIREETSATELTITRRSLRERKVKEPTVAKAKTSPGNSPEHAFKDLNFKMSLLEGHHHDTYSVDLYGNFVVSGGRDTSVKLWVASSQEELKSLGGHDGTISGIRFMKDKYFATYPNAVTASYDCSICVWDLEKGKCSKSIYVYSPVICLDYSDGLAAIGTEGGKVELYDVESGDNVFSVKAHEDGVSAIKMLPGNKITSGSSEGILKIFDTKSDTKEEPIFVLEPEKLNIKLPIDTKVNTALKSKTLILSKINCITCWNEFVIYGDEGYNIKMLDYAKGELTKVRNNLKEYCPTEAVNVAKVHDFDFLFSIGSDVDRGDGYVNVRSLPDLRYICTIRDAKEISGPITSFCLEDVDSHVRFITGGRQLRTWDQIKRRGRKRKGSFEDESVVPCKFNCNYTEPRESEMESDSDESVGKSQSSKESSTKEPVNQSWCSIL